MKLDATAYFQCAKGDVKSVKQHTRTWYFEEKIYVSMQEIRPECKVCELRYQPISKCSLYMNTIYYFKYQRKMLFF